MEFIGNSKEIEHIKYLIKKAATSNASVLIIGETGTGKEIIASQIHTNSKRVNNPYICVNCAAIQDTLLESELFGHEKGAYTGAHIKKIGKLQQANKGTLFLDEISNMSLAIQAKILRAIEYQTFEPVGGVVTITTDTRIVSASNKNIKELIKINKFREDLFYRIKVIQINVPPLRQRIEDVPLLTKYFINQFATLYNKPNLSLSNNALKILMSYTWPGNIRELKNTLEQAVLFSKKPILSEFDIKPESENNYITSSKSSEDIINSTISYLSSNGYKGKMGEALEDIEKKWILKALEKNKNIQKDAVKLLGISPRVLCYKLKKYGIKVLSAK
jgi:transcriptional regulator with PAS, ATPase and Fis domain